METVRSILNEYLQIFPNEHQQIRQLNELVENSSSDNELFSRKNFIGHITVSGFVVSQTRSKALMLYHKTLLKFLPPGGHIEPGEYSPLQAALREIKEESGITAVTYLPLNLNNELPIDIDTHPIPENQSKKEPRHWHHDFRYLFICKQENQKVVIDDSESIEYQWVDINELQRMETFVKVATKIHKALHADCVKPD